jgi:hypothetical protein
MNPADKLKFITRICDKAFQLAVAYGNGDLAAVKKSILQLLIQLTDKPFDEVNKNKPDYITKAMLKELHEAGITVADFKSFEGESELNLTLVRESLIKILENSRVSLHPVNFVTAKNILEAIIAGGQSDLLTAEENAALQKAKFTATDLAKYFSLTDGVSLDALTKYTNFTPRALLDFFDSLSADEQGDLEITLRKQRDNIAQLLQEQLSVKKNFELLMKDFIALLSGKDSSDTELNTAFAAVVDQRFRGLLLTDAFFKHLMERSGMPFYITRLQKSNSQINRSLQNQTIKSGKQFVADFKMWAGCQSYGGCHREPALPLFEMDSAEDNQVIQNIASNILSAHANEQASHFYNLPYRMPGLDEAVIIMDTLLRSSELAKYVTPDFATAEALKNFLLTADHKEQVIAVMQKQSLLYQADEAHNFYLTNTIERPNHQWQVMVEAMEAWVSCYVVAQNSTAIRDICHSLWNATYDLIALPVGLAAPAVSQALVYAPDAVLTSGHRNVAANDHFSALEYAQFALIAGSVVCVGASLYNRFFKPKTVKKPESFKTMEIVTHLPTHKK